MGKRCRIDHNKPGAIGAGLLPVNKFSLAGLQRVSCWPRRCSTAAIDLLKGTGTVNTGFAGTEKVQIGAVNEKNIGICVFSHFLEFMSRSIHLSPISMKLDVFLFIQECDQFFNT